MGRPLRISFALGALAVHLACAAEPVRFSETILPLLSDRCFHCHGPDEAERQAGLRLDVEAEAKRSRESGQAIVPGHPEKSTAWQRIVSTDPNEVMPPPDAHRQAFTNEERELLKRWIAEGAVWGKHWAFEKPRKVALPGGAAHPVDAFVRDRLVQVGRVPAESASAHTQLRRVSFGLTGLPPSPEDVAAFEAEPSDANWQRIVNRLLESPHYGERMAMWWLDAARYSDTDGYQQDAERTNWPWRDWVIDAFNANMGFDQFTIEQFAGDLLPEATPEQVLATCFHRNHMANGEGGRLPEESRIDYVIDRVNTVGTVWLGLTLGCTQCHSHKFDPISQEEYYQLFAFFDSIDEDGKAGGNAKPFMHYQSPKAARAVEEMRAYVEKWKPREGAAREAAEGRFEKRLATRLETLTEDYRAWRAVAPHAMVSAEGTAFLLEEDGSVQTHGAYPRQDDYRITFRMPPGMDRLTGWQLEVLPHASHTDGRWSRGRAGDFILTNVKLLMRRKGESQVTELALTSAVATHEKGAKGRNYGNVKDTLDDDPRNGWTADGIGGQAVRAVFALAEPHSVSTDEEYTVVLLHRSTQGDANIGRLRLSVTDERGETITSTARAPWELAAGQSVEGLDPALRERLRQQALLDDDTYQKVRAHYEEAKRQLKECEDHAKERRVMVLQEREDSRQSHILLRGVWDAKGEVVERGVLPAVLKWPEEQTQTREDLARWLVDPDNPLTARVVVNHLWQLLFGAGLVRTPEDFGLQGERPTHPRLLDWLAVELVEHDWDLKHLLRVIVTSETYRQSSLLSADLLETDPENRLLARAPRFRLPAWMIRDHALAASGLLNPAVGGPPVKPWQPVGVWQEIFMGRFTYRPSVGPAQYRRTVYAYWRRSSAPTFLFDSAQRRVCEVGARRTNTPLHALTLLNDTTMFEASRHLALRAIQDMPENERVEGLVNRVLSRAPSEEETALLERELARNREYYHKHPSEATQYVNQTWLETTVPATELASYTLLASMVLNLDEAMTHE